ncbi:uncharacterized protein isoform X4 [Rhodnius prolixus]|uniref:uncharacterized protein isoform X4 n=1 Tax=Rhodnius prolixus TaxID=13249 RepID=UPI003D18B39B
MALNFSASFAACLAAGLKVPRQFMYCIAQDPGPPYVVYKDSGGGSGGASSGGGGMMGPPPNSEWAEHFANSSPSAPPTSAPSSHESPQHQQNLHNSQQQHAGSPSPPYPQQQHTPANSLSVSVDDGSDGAAGAETAASSHESTGASQDELACPELPSTPAPPQQHYYGSGNNVGSSGGGGGGSGTTAGAGGGGATGGGGGGGGSGGGSGSSGGGNAAGSGGSSGANSHGGGAAGAGQAGSGGGSTASTGSGGSSGGGGNTRVPSHPHPQHMISPTAFMSYLKQPVVLTSLNSSELAEFHSGMPELLSGGLKGMSGNNSSGNSQGKNCELRLFKCLTCGKDFKQKSTLLQHERIHTDSRPYGCTECGKRFRQQSHLTQHLRIHANEKPFACVYCERTFRQRAILNQHLRIHSDVSPHLVYKNGQLWPQDVPFPGENNKEALMNLTQHGGSQYENQGSQGEANGQCFSPDGSVNQFPAYFKDAKVYFPGVAHGVLGPTKGLPELLQSGRQAGMPLYVRCPICQKEFKQKSTLLQHGCIHIESRPYPCVECGKRFRQQSHLTQHLRIHTNEKPYGCLYCGRNFRQRTILNQHVRIHTGEKPYKCLQCGKDFRQKAILDQHTRTHQGDRPYCCPMPNCRRRFSTEPELKRHVDNHMNPHSTKRRNTANNTGSGGGSGGGGGASGCSVNQLGSVPTSLTANNLSQPSMVVKPELYLPAQCYGPAAAAAAAFQQQYTMSQLLQPSTQSTALVQ